MRRPSPTSLGGVDEEEAWDDPARGLLSRMLDFGFRVRAGLQNSECVLVLDWGLEKIRARREPALLKLLQVMARVLQVTMTRRVEGTQGDPHSEKS